MPVASRRTRPMTITTIRFPRPRLARPAGLALAAGIVLAGTALLRSGDAPSPVVATPDLGATVNAAPDRLPPAARVAFWEPRAASGSYLDLLFLADAYVERGRVTGDLGDLERAAAALDRAAPTAPDRAAVDVRRAGVAFSLHRFVEAAEIAERLVAADERNLAALGILGDARLEVGDVDAARRAYEQLGELAPSPAVWSRQGRLAFLTGDPDGAERFVARALDAARADAFPDEIAFYATQLADLRRLAGDLAGSEAAYALALEALPEHAPALAGLGRLREAQGRREEAVSLLSRSVELLPLPEVIATLADLETLAGRPDRAADHLALVDRIGEVGQAVGTVYDRQLVLVAADHGRDPERAVAMARAELQDRQDVYGWDALAWALHAAGDLDAAADASRRALALGTPDPRLRYHAGMIALARGDRAAARPLLEAALAGRAALPPLQVEALQGALASLAARP